MVVHHLPIISSDDDIDSSVFFFFFSFFYFAIAFAPSSIRTNQFILFYGDISRFNCSRMWDNKSIDSIISTLYSRCDKCSSSKEINQKFPIVFFFKRSNLFIRMEFEFNHRFFFIRLIHLLKNIINRSLHHKHFILMDFSLVYNSTIKLLQIEMMIHGQKNFFNDQLFQCQCNSHRCDEVLKIHCLLKIDSSTDNNDVFTSLSTDDLS